jgi:adhesin HecA-like repeat protein
MAFFICLLGALQSQGLENDREPRALAGISTISSTGTIEVKCDEGLSFDGNSISATGNLTIKADNITLSGLLSASGSLLIESEGRIFPGGSNLPANDLIKFQSDKVITLIGSK